MLHCIKVGKWHYFTHDASGRPVQPLGRGSFGTVWKGQETQSGELVAIKCLKSDDPNLFKHIDNELRIHKELNHPNVVRCLYAEDFKVGHVRHINMVLEYMGGGDLEKHLTQKYPHGMPENVARRFLCQIASAFQYLSSRRLSHRDLKPANMLLTDGPEPIVKVADFGFARESEPGTLMLSKVGSPLYMAPEILTEQAYTSSADVWSTGILFMQLLTGTRPFPHATSELDIINTIRAGKLNPPSNVSLECQQTIQKMLNADHKRRLTWDQFVQLDYVRPSLKSHQLDKSVTEVAGQVNWILSIISFETGSSFALPVSATLSIVALKKLMAPTLDGSKNAQELMLLSRNHGLMLDEHTVGDYFKPPAQAKPGDSPASSSPMENAVFACWSSTWSGKMPLARLSFPDCPVLDNPSFPLNQISGSGVDSSNWHNKFTAWKLSLEAHLRHAEELKGHAAYAIQRTYMIASAVNRKGAYLVLNNHLRSSYAKLILRFERVSQVIKEVGPQMAIISKELRPMIKKMETIPLLPLCKAFPTINLAHNATLSQLLNGEGMLRDLAMLEQDHQNLLRGELMFSESSDAAAASHYGIEGYNYKGPSFQSGVAVVTPQPGVKTPELIAAMADINNALSDVKLQLSQRIEAQASDILSTINPTLDGLLVNFTNAAKLAIDTLNSALTKPTSFSLTPEMLSQVIPHMTSSSTHYDVLVTAFAALKNKLVALVETRYEYDESFANVLSRIAPWRQSFATFEDKFNSDWSSLVLDRIAQKSRSLFRLVGFPQAYQDLLCEVERRRLWTEAMHSSIKASRSSYEALIQAETVARDSWHATHSGVLNRFVHVLPTGHELLLTVPPGYMKVTISEQGLHPYPQLEGVDVSSASSSLANFATPPPPQNPTEETLAKMISGHLISHVYSLQRELDSMTRQRTGFFHVEGADAVLRKEYQAMQAENAELKRQNLLLQQQLAARK